MELMGRREPVVATVVEPALEAAPLAPSHFHRERVVDNTCLHVR